VEGLSISGWGADSLRYREIFSSMARGVEAARAQGKVEVLLAGADSVSNTFDKFFSDGSDDYLKWLDAVTIHYQGMASPANIKKWMNRKSPNGRVKIWDTESWVANTDDRVAAVVAANRMAGYDRSMGIYGGNIASERLYRDREIFGATGKKERIDEPVTAWSVAAAVGAMQHFVGERPFRTLLFPNGLPWVMVFDGLNQQANDGTVVVVGDIGEAFGQNNVPFRTVQTSAVAQQKSRAGAQLAALPQDAPAEKRDELQNIIDKADVRTGTLTIPTNRAYALYDFYGNAVPAKGGRIEVPLDHRGFFLRPSGARGSFDTLLNALRKAEVRGFEAVEMVPSDMTSPVENGATIQVKITNVLNRTVSGTVQAAIPGLQVSGSKVLSLKPHEVQTVPLLVRGAARPDNVYPLQLTLTRAKMVWLITTRICASMSSRKRRSLLMASWTTGKMRCRRLSARKTRG
jgi:hypothetical protein